MPPDLTRFLLDLHQAVRENLRQFLADPDRATGQNPKGDVQREFDLATDRLVRQQLKAFFPAGVIVSEEQPDERFGAGPPQWRFVVDPVDGSDNWRRRLPLSALCVSAFPPDGPLRLEEQAWSLVGDLGSDAAILAWRGGGAWLGERRLRTSGVRRLAEAAVTCQLGRQAPHAGLARLIAEARSLRCYGSAAHDVGLIATGQIDAHVDVRGRLTPESILAAALAVEEAGGVVVAETGRPLPPFQALTDRHQLIAAATPELAAEIVARLQSAG